MKTYQFLLLLNFAGWPMLFCPPVIAENTIQISQDYFNNLGVTLGKLEPAKQIPVLTAPAKVVIPSTHEYIVSASQAGLITKLNAAMGDNVKKGEVLAQLNSPDLLSMQRLYLKAVSEMQLGSLAYQRDKKLLADGVIAERRWQETQSQYNAFVSEANEHKQLLEIAGMTDSEIDRLGQNPPVKQSVKFTFSYFRCSDGADGGSRRTHRYIGAVISHCQSGRTLAGD